MCAINFEVTRLLVPHTLQLCVSYNVLVHFNILNDQNKTSFIFEGPKIHFTLNLFQVQAEFELVTKVVVC